MITGLSILLFILHRARENLEGKRIEIVLFACYTLDIPILPQYLVWGSNRKM